jgi:hypothetical protein
MTAKRGGYDLMPEQDCRPTNKYLPPRPRRDGPHDDAAPVTLATAPGGFLAWVDEMLSQ